LPPLDELRHPQDVTSTKIFRRSILGAALAAPAIVSAQSGLPDRTLRIVIGFAAGGGSDAMARLIATGLERRVGRRVTVENRPGGTGAAAGEALKYGGADGTMVAFMPSPSLVARLFTPSYPFDPMTDLAPITTAGTYIDAFAVSPKIEARTVAEYVAWLKGGEAGRNKIGATATDAMLQYYTRALGREFGVPMEGQAFRGTAPLVNDMEAGRVPAGVAGLTSFLVAHRGNRVRILATSGSKRVSVAPDLPTAAEAGYPGLTMEEWYGFFAAASMPPALVDLWNGALVATLQDREVREQLAQLGLEVETSTPAVCADRLAAHMKKWQATLQALGMKPTL
jgi:tripartite-type tricarboxylate transporter receptor subunit TctC